MCCSGISLKTCKKKWIGPAKVWKGISLAWIGSLNNPSLQCSAISKQKTSFLGSCASYCKGSDLKQHWQHVIAALGPVTTIKSSCVWVLCSNMSYVRIYCVYSYEHFQIYIHDTYIYIYIECACVYMYIYIYIQANTDTRSQRHRHIHIHTHLHTYTHTHICNHTTIYTHTHIHISTYAHKHIYTYTHIHMYMYIYIYTYIQYTHVYTFTIYPCTRLQTYANIYTHILLQWDIHIFLHWRIVWTVPEPSSFRGLSPRALPFFFGLSEDLPASLPQCGVGNSEL